MAKGIFSFAVSPQRFYAQLVREQRRVNPDWEPYRRRERASELYRGLVRDPRATDYVKLRERNLTGARLSDAEARALSRTAWSYLYDYPDRKQRDDALATWALGTIGKIGPGDYYMNGRLVAEA